MAADDLKSHALTSSQDFYALLEIPPSASETEIRRAYRKTALKYHPDKVGASQSALDKFHLLQIGYDVLSDPTVKELYDNARRARQAKAERNQAFEGRRKWMKEDLERRESGAFKRKRDVEDEEEAFARELRRISEENKRTMRVKAEDLRREAEEGNGEAELEEAPEKSNGSGEVPEIDRSITLRFVQRDETAHIDKAEIMFRFSRFGPIDEAVLRDKKLKSEGQKHRQSYTTAVLVFKSIVGAHAAVTDFAKLKKSDPETYALFEAVDWASGQQPSYIPESKTSTPQTPATKPRPRAEDLLNGSAAPSTPMHNGNGAGLKKVPSFGSFKGTPTVARGQNSPSLDEITMIRLKNAERRRMEEKIRREEAAAAVDEDGKT